MHVVSQYDLLFGLFVAGSALAPASALDEVRKVLASHQPILLKSSTMSNKFSLFSRSAILVEISRRRIGSFTMTISQPLSQARPSHSLLLMDLTTLAVLEATTFASTSFVALESTAPVLPQQLLTPSLLLPILRLKVSPQLTRLL